MTRVNTITDVFEIWASLADMAEAIGRSHWTVQKWSQRKSIPSDAWPDLIDAARRKGKKLSAEQLLSMHGSSMRRASGE
jgi:prophage antirepressor-like protein